MKKQNTGFKIYFQNVGRAKASWTTTTLPSLEYRTLLKAVKGRIASRFPEFAVDDDGTGTIFAGFHGVGRFDWKAVP